MAVEARHAGERVRKRRLELHFSQQQLAALVGVPVQTISKVERGEIIPRDYLRAALAVSLAVDMGQLFPWPSRVELTEAAS